MKRMSVLVGALLSLLMLLPGNCSAATAAPGAAENNIRVLIAYQPDHLKTAPHILAAYQSVLEEEGVSCKGVEIGELLKLKADKLVRTTPVLILPDTLLQNVPEELDVWIDQYLTKGGNVILSYDVGVKDPNGLFLKRAALAHIVGLNYITYATTGPAAYELGAVRFSSEAGRDFFQIPPGKTVDGVWLSSYTYGALDYPIARNEALWNIPEKNIYAYGVTKKQEKFPLLTLADYGKGKVLYINLPLGYLKAYSDDLPMRSILRTFLFEVVGMPHVMNVEQGRGGIVLNWHVDSDIEHISLPYLLAKGIFRKEIAASIHVTAGNFFLKPGDDTGFAADKRGRHLVLALKEYGRIGSHGGWAHNWFSENVSNGTFKEKEIREYIAKNNESLEKIVGYKVIEYAAPNGAHPQPAATKALEALGIIAYYYVGDTGSVPNRVFANGQMVSDKVIAFPIMPLGKYGSIWEIKALGKTPEKVVEEWFSSTLDYVVKNKTVRLIYSHPYDYQNYPAVMDKFFDTVVRMQAEQEITVRPMSEYAKFFLRFLKTEYSFQDTPGQLQVKLVNSEGLDGITVAIPKKKYRQPTVNGMMIKEDQNYYYLTIAGRYENEKTFAVDAL